MAQQILIAGIGNIFFGDDAFGCEVAWALSRQELPDEVTVADFGTRSYDLAYAIMAPSQTVIMVDALPRGESPGTVYLIKPDAGESDSCGNSIADGHSMNPMRVLQLVTAMGGIPSELYLVGCEPAVFETEELGLSEAVRAAIPRAIEMIQALVRALMTTNPPMTDQTATNDLITNRQVV